MQVSKAKSSIIKKSEKLTVWQQLKTPVIIVTVLRLSGYIYTYFSPLTGLILSWIFDYVDSMVLYMFGVPYNYYYHRIDKRLDYLQYIMLLPLVYFTPVFEWYVIALIYRTIGDLVVWKTGKRQLFVLFPNFIEYLYFIYLITIEFNLGIEWNHPYLLTGLFVWKMFQETNIHIIPLMRKNSIPDYDKGFSMLPKIHKWEE